MNYSALAFIKLSSMIECFLVATTATGIHALYCYLMYDLFESSIFILNLIIFIEGFKEQFKLVLEVELVNCFVFGIKGCLKSVKLEGSIKQSAQSCFQGFCKENRFYICFHLDL